MSDYTRLRDLLGTQVFEMRERLELRPGEYRELLLESFSAREGAWGPYWSLSLRDPEGGRCYYLSTSSKQVHEVMQKLSDMVGTGKASLPVMVRVRRLRRTWVID